ncbi:MAG: alginate O-acetyltransferase AlgX-related protein, partial [Gemmataceae bacterium]
MGNLGAIRSYITVFLFLLTMAVPIGGMFWRANPLAPHEKRLAYSPPPWPREQWQRQAFPLMAEAYINDHTGYRPELLQLRTHLLHDILGDSTTPAVWVGREGWLFINTGGAREGFPHQQPDPTARLQKWAAHFRTIHNELARRGISYQLLIAPDKDRIYPEFLPAAHARHPVPTSVPQLQALLPEVELLDPTAAMLAHKATTSGKLYFQRDSHWTDAGAFPAYQQLMHQARRPSRPVTDFRVTPIFYEQTDLSMALGLNPEAWPERYEIWRTNEPSPGQLPADDLLKIPERLTHLT